jgi:predicted dehydrogenase
MLFEKPSHNTAKDAAKLVSTLKANGLYNRVIVGMHDSVHPSRAKLLNAIKKRKAEVREVNVVFNYPKDPQDPSSWRLYHPVYGGAQLDLGIYVYKLAKDIGSKIGFDLKNFDQKGRKITVKRVNPSKVDIDVSARLQYTVDDRKIAVNLDTAITPGNVPRAEVRVVLANGD